MQNKCVQLELSCEDVMSAMEEKPSLSAVF